MKRRVARKFYYYLLNGKIFKSSVDISCLDATSIEDVYKKYESKLEKIVFYMIDGDGNETAERAYYFGTVYKGLQSLKINERDEYDKIKANRKWEQDAENDDVFVRTESGRFITISEPDRAIDVSDYIQKRSDEKELSQ